MLRVADLFEYTHTHSHTLNNRGFKMRVDDVASSTCLTLLPDLPRHRPHHRVHAQRRDAGSGGPDPTGAPRGRSSLQLGQLNSISGSEQPFPPNFGRFRTSRIGFGVILPIRRSLFWV